MNEQHFNQDSPIHSAIGGVDGYVQEVANAKLGFFQGHVIIRPLRRTRYVLIINIPSAIPSAQQQLFQCPSCCTCVICIGISGALLRQRLDKIRPGSLSKVWVNDGKVKVGAATSGLRVHLLDQARQLLQGGVHPCVDLQLVLGRLACKNDRNTTEVQCQV